MLKMVSTPSKGIFTDVLLVTFELQRQPTCEGIWPGPTAEVVIVAALVVAAVATGPVPAAASTATHPKALHVLARGTLLQADLSAPLYSSVEETRVCPMKMGSCC